MDPKSTTRHENAAKSSVCVAFALRLLGRRALTALALEDRLAQEGFCAPDIAQAMAQLRTWGYINDDRLWESVVAAAIRQKKGPAWLRQQLSRRQVPHHIASRCLQALACDAEQLAVELLTSRFRPEELALSRSCQRAMRLLQRRGFSPSVCAAALRAVSPRGSRGSALHRHQDDAGAPSSGADEP